MEVSADEFAALLAAVSTWHEMTTLPDLESLGFAMDDVGPASHE